MINITDRDALLRTPPYWRLAFRPFFSLGALVAALLIPLWLASLNGLYSLPRPALWWHGHEMLLGFGPAIVAGFLLTAVQNWVGRPGLSGKPLVALVLSWLAARVLLLLPLPWYLPAFFDLAFNLGLVLALWHYLKGPNQKHNRLLVLLPALLLLLNGASYGLLADQALSHSRNLWLAVLVWFCLVMVVIGTRVMPFFTARRAGLETPERNLKVMKLTLVALAATAGCWLAGLDVAIWRWPALIAAALLLWPLKDWYQKVIWQEPLLWSLWLAWLSLPLGLVLLAFLPQHQSAILHLPAIGGMGLMMLGMMMRVSLGHTGRFVYGPPRLGWLLVLLFAGALLRAFLPLAQPALSNWAWLLAGGCWVLAFGGFFLRYLPMLASARVDGQPG
ncbi:NnrS family protein [Gallaecimonas sp. GXIMD4217]|uniref:NnrS family protein n=1 Tax=Gallaecimonas sp. GXIMD4217 TaxID=3131927 RepID=UPI00311AC727